MEHADALERMEIAAVEPDGLERLMAGDTPDAAAVAGHLAGCPECTGELARLRRVSVLAREAIRSLPDPALRERTLALVRDVGRDRSAASLPAPSRPMASFPPASSSVTGSDAAGLPAPVSIVPARRSRPRFVALSGLAAALVVAGVLGFAAAGVVRAPVLDTHQQEVAFLSTVAETSLRIEQRPDVTHVALAATNGSATPRASLVLSSSGGELVMVADGLAPAPDGQEYGCWIETGGQRRRIGRMYAAGGVQAWAGPVDGLAALQPGAVFGVSLVPVGGGAGEPVLTGRL